VSRTGREKTGGVMITLKRRGVSPLPLGYEGAGDAGKIEGA